MKNIPGVLLTLLLCSILTPLQAADDMPAAFDLISSAQNLLALVSDQTLPTDQTKLTAALTLYNISLKQFSSNPADYAEGLEKDLLQRAVRQVMEHPVCAECALYKKLSSLRSMSRFSLAVWLVAGMTLISNPYYEAHLAELRCSQAFRTLMNQTISLNAAILKLYQPSNDDVEETPTGPAGGEAQTWVSTLYNSLSNLQDIANSVLR
ncbi:hypothetical protein EBZ39_04655, partial [bacterium]|nr:hypothetical protein [bacterium]